ncbi:MAG: hypothetical protein ACRCX2_18470 [Paraclostridium sp.]
MVKKIGITKIPVGDEYVEINERCELIPKRSIEIEDEWLSGIKDLYYYLFCTMGNFLQVDTPFENESRLDENGQHVGDITAGFSIKPSRDGYYLLQHYASLYPNTYNRIMRGLLDTCGRFESKYHDATTTFLIFSCALLLETKDMNIVDAKKFIDKVKVHLGRCLEINRLPNNEENAKQYIRSAISCMDTDSINGIIDVIMSSPRGSVSVAAQDFPPEGSTKISEHLYIEKADGCRVLLYNMTPFSNISKLKVVPLILQDCTLDGEILSKFIDINMDVLQESSSTFTMIFCKYYDSQDKVLLNLITRYKIILCSIPAQYLDNLDTISIFSRILGAPVIYQEESINQDLNTVIISTESTTDTSSKILSIHNPHMKNFAEGEVNSYIASAYACNSSTDKVVLDRNRFIFNLLSFTKVKLHLLYNSSHEKIMYMEKVRDVVNAHGSDLLKGGFVKSIYKLFSFTKFEVEEIDSFVFGILDTANNISFPNDEHVNGNYIDLYDATYNAISWACNFAYEMKRTVFAVSKMGGN